MPITYRTYLEHNLIILEHAGRIPDDDAQHQTLPGDLRDSAEPC